MKRTIAILLLIATLLSAFSITAFADDDDDNAMTGEGTTGQAAKGYAWYSGILVHHIIAVSVLVNGRPGCELRKVWIIML